MMSNILDDHILIRVEARAGAYRFLEGALHVWHARHGGLLGSEFRRTHGEAHLGTSLSAFDPALSSAALDELTLLFESFFAPGPVLWEYVPASYVA